VYLLGETLVFKVISEFSLSFSITEKSLKSLLEKLCYFELFDELLLLSM